MHHEGGRLWVPDFQPRTERNNPTYRSDPMAAWKTPPKAKVYEALSAIADGRVKLSGPHTAEVQSSSGSKWYRVEWSDDQTRFTANDNASYWQGYLGYPIISVILSLGKVPLDPNVANHLRNINWHKINKEFKRDYDAAIAYVLDRVANEGTTRAGIIAEVDRIFQDIVGLRLSRMPGKPRPPKD
jgi:hypothetical protein